MPHARFAMHNTASPRCGQLTWFNQLQSTFDPWADNENLMINFFRAGIVDFSFSKLQEASVPINGTFELLLNGDRTPPIQYGATSQQVP